jgi:glutamine synthetase
MSTELIDIVFPDLLGLLHGKTVPAHRIDHPTHYAVTAMILGLDGSYLETEGYSTSAGFPDMEARIDPDTVRPWVEGRQTAMAYLYDTQGRPVPFDARRQLKALVDRWEDLGYTPMAGFEMEFFLLERLQPMTRLPVPDHRVYGVGPAADPSGTLEELGLAAEHAQLHLEGMNSEFTSAQVEAALHYQPALAAADGALLFRELTRRVARSRGIDATYMPRPFDDTVGSGMHVNLSLSDGASDNAFSDPGDPQGISDLARHFIAGLLEHHCALAAVAAPTVNSYKRLSPGLLSGYWANWGLDNRITSVRVPGQRGSSTRVEHRVADGTASPHLLGAALLAAGLHGVEEKLPLPDPQVGDADAAPNTEKHTPHSLAESLEALAADDVLVDLLDRRLVDAFIELKRQENDRWLRAVTDWEQREYGRVY